MRTSYCACGATIELAPRGRPRLKCDGCRKAAAVAHQRKYVAKIKDVPRTCRDCGQLFTGTQPTTCGRCHSLRLNPGGAERGPWGQERTLAKVRERLVNEATHCALCSLPIDRAVRFPDPLAPQVDHIIQRIDGGGDEESNLRIVHARCNNAWSKVVPKYRLGAARGAVWLQAAGF